MNDPTERPETGCDSDRKKIIPWGKLETPGVNWSFDKDPYSYWEAELQGHRSSLFVPPTEVTIDGRAVSFEVVSCYKRDSELDSRCCTTLTIAATDDDATNS